MVLPGLLGSADNWRSIAQQLAPCYTLYLVDHRNHGQSFHSREMTYAAMAEDVKCLIDQLGLLNPILIGHSMGGKVAMEFAQTYPEALSKLIVVDIAPRAYNMSRLAKVLHILRQVPLQDVRTRAAVDRYLSHGIPETLMRLYCMKNLGRNERGMLVWNSNIVALSESIPHLEQAVVFHQPFDKPTLFIKAGQSDYMHEQDLELIQAMFPKYSLQCIEEASHWVNHHQPQALLKLLVQFLARTE